MSVAIRRSRAVSTVASTRCARPQASRSAGVLQQQLVKHCSAVAQPHGLSMQGKGLDRSFPASRLAATGSEAAGVRLPTGSGKPEATMA
jgi:hypothetical protein